ncbi:DMT family transporter [Ruegeria sp. 2012CJ41-6]|uniref:DMT family transporter n=1 Tax=Ruegeria spongiae TaxID=2942209 RepID=A0ABT0Q0M1_9RHOB|nr:DMT family transporter [Ruegeria spongiae]MCL6282992.1 DMT family transporter [Ruegeria spongiae]
MSDTSQNLRGAILMSLAMLGFALEDMFIKLMADLLPTWQILAILGGGGALVFAAMTVASGQPLWTRAYLKGSILLRNVAEIVGTVGFVTAIALTPISQASAILQATPLVVTIGAALFLGEQVGPRRWSAVMIGFLGVLLVIRPGTEGFDAKSLFAVQGVIGLAVRDVVTRRVGDETSSLQLSFLAFLTLIPSAVILACFSDQVYVSTSIGQWALFAGFVLVAAAAYLAIVASMRVGEVSFVTPFRYSRIVFALIIGTTVFGERPDLMMLTGVAVIVGAGIYVVWRERVVGVRMEKDEIPGT